jgi:hypothetical protein
MQYSSVEYLRCLSYLFGDKAGVFCMYNHDCTTHYKLFTSLTTVHTIHTVNAPSSATTTQLITLAHDYKKKYFSYCMYTVNSTSRYTFAIANSMRNIAILVLKLLKFLIKLRYKVPSEYFDVLCIL